MMDLSTKKDIDNLSYEILRGSKSLDVFPTPIDAIVTHAELVVSTTDLSKIPPNYVAKSIDAFKRVMGKLQGMLDRREKVVYLDLSSHPSKQKFVKLHEVGHKVLPWQQGSYDGFEDDEYTLNADTREEFEAEANYFASCTFFQQDRFFTEMDKLGLGMDAALLLAKLFGASNHATLRRYVEYSKKRCALIVLEERTACGASLRDIFQSQSFTNEFGKLSLPSKMDIVYPFVLDYCCNRRHKVDGSMSLPTNNGSVRFSYHFFNNTYNAFVLLFPMGEKKSTKTRIVFQGA